MEDDESQIIIKRWMMSDIENSKVFILYAWKNEECAGLVRFLNSRLLYLMHPKQTPY